MRGAKVETQSMFSYLSPEQRVPADHPLHVIRVIVDLSLAELGGHFRRIYSHLGCPSIPRSISFVPCCCKSFTASGRSDD